MRPGAAAWTDMRQSLVPTTSDSRGGAPTTFTKGEPEYARSSAPDRSASEARVFT